MLKGSSIDALRFWIQTLIIAVIIIWSFWHAFLGVDLVDTGYYYYQYTYPRGAEISYTGYLATLIGAAWIRIFPSAGLFGLSILELFFEYSLCIIVYLTFRNTFRRISILVGLLLCMLAISTYVNVFNYHQLSMFFCTVMTCAMYTGLRKEKMHWQIIAGAAAACAMFCRIACVLCLLCSLCIIYWRLVVKGREKRKVLCEVLSFFVGFLIVVALMALLFWALGVLQHVINDVLRIVKLGESTTSTYGMGGQTSHLITDTMFGVAAALSFIISGLVGSFFIQLLINKVRSESSNPLFIGAIAFCTLVGVAVSIIGGCFAMYWVGHAPSYAQLTSFSWFVYGLQFIIGILLTGLGLFFCVKRRRKASKKTEDSAKELVDNSLFGHDAGFALLGLALVMLSFVGSAARAKHVILGMWFFAPLIIDRLIDLYEGGSLTAYCKEKVKTWIRAGVILSSALFICGFCCFLANTNNFDDPDLSQLTEEIHSDKVRYLKTTQRKSDAVNEVIDKLDSYSWDGRRLAVYGNPILFYSLLDKRAYVRPWISGSSYSVADFRRDFTEAQKSRSNLPVIIEARTDCYEGFGEQEYQSLLEKQKAANNRSEKYKVIQEFLKSKEYRLLMVNDYFIVWVPKSST